MPGGVRGSGGDPAAYSIIQVTAININSGMIPEV